MRSVFMCDKKEDVCPPIRLVYHCLSHLVRGIRRRPRPGTPVSRVRNYEELAELSFIFVASGVIFDI